VPKGFVHCAETNWPTTPEPPAPSVNSTEATIVDSSQTVPQRTHTASPELSFQSMSVERHSGFEQRICDIVSAALFRKKKPTVRARLYIRCGGVPA
jgi:hypothetical protein